MFSLINALEYMGFHIPKIWYILIEIKFISILLPKSVCLFLDQTTYYYIFPSKKNRIFSLLIFFRAPCCQASIFPYTTTIFEKCLLLAIGDLYATPTDFWRPGVAGPKFNMTSPHRVEALIVEYDSNVTFRYYLHFLLDINSCCNFMYLDYLKINYALLQFQL